MKAQPYGTKSSPNGEGPTLKPNLLNSDRRPKLWPNLKAQIVTEGQIGDLKLNLKAQSEAQMVPGGPNIKP